MDANCISTKTGSINGVTGYFISACCRSEVFVEEKETNPRCPECGKPTEWSITLRRSGRHRPTLRRDARRNDRCAAPKGFLALKRIEWNGFGLDDVRVVNYSQTGIAVDVSDPAIFFGQV